jgi:beta-phosphoglucomutase-like phosphatase (HAD superfamily)/tRNA(Arg) A34 adenosine deaminase TadA
MPPAIIFDLDGTLVDTNGLHTVAWQEAFARYGFRVGYGRIAIEIGKGSSLLMPSILGRDLAASWADALRAAHGEAYLKLVEAEGVTVFEGSEELLRACRERGLSVAIATGSKKKSLDRVSEVAGLDLENLTHELLTDDDVDHPKPNPSVVEAAFRKLERGPLECLMVGDTVYDGEARRRAGVAFVGVETWCHDREALERSGARAVYAGPEEMLDKLDQVLDLIPPASPDTGAINEAMKRALDEARAGMQNGEVPIGAVLITPDGTVVAAAHNTVRKDRSPLSHAEMNVLRAADHAPGRTLVTSMEPCIMCMGAAIAAGIDTIVYAIPAPPNGATTRLAYPSTSVATAPRILGEVKAADALALLEEWLSQHPEDTFVRSVLRG